MFNNQQIYQSKIDITVGGSSISGFPVTINIMSQDLQWSPVFWDSDSDVSLSGRKRSNIRGYDLKITLDYETTLEPDKVATILDGLAYAINSNYVIQFFPDASDTSTSFEVIPSSATERSISYEQTVKGADSPTLVFENSQLLNSVTDTGGTTPIQTDVDAQTLDGLDSTQFLRSDVIDYFTGGTLYMQGTLDMGLKFLTNLRAPTNNNDAATKGYVDTQTLGTKWQEGVIDRVDDPSALSPADGDRYLVGTSPVGDFSAHANYLAVWNDGTSSWDFFVPEEGYALEIESNGYFWIWNGTTWVRFGSAISHNQLQDLDASDHLGTAADAGISFYDASNDVFQTSGNATLDSTGNAVFADVDMQALTATTVDTGHGANELYPMNQGVRTTDNVEFEGIDINSSTFVDASRNITAGTGTFSGLLSAQDGSRIVGQSPDRNVEFDSLIIEGKKVGSSRPYAGFRTGITFRGRTYNDPSVKDLAKIHYALNDSLANTKGTSLVFDVMADSTDTSVFEAMRIDYAGNVSIGKSSASAKLDVNGTGNFSDLLTAQGGIDVTGGNLLVTDGTDNTYIKYYGLESDRGAVYIRPTTDQSQDLHIGYDPGYQTWNNIKIDAVDVNVSATMSVSNLLTAQGGIDVTGDADVSGRVSNDISNFVSGFTGSNWAIRDTGSNNWQLDVDDAYIRGALYANEFIINQILAINGSDIVSPGRGKIEALSGSAPSETVTVSDPQGNNVASFVANDIVLVQTVRPDNNQIVKRIVRKVSSKTGNDVTLTSLGDAPVDAGSLAKGCDRGHWKHDRHY